ncbi:MAG: SUMF1/EgtB/PvdO family nonheme iron enzyme [Deltaproteobacteria bacterium]|nr:SUMF1/EgtB/PvdO family nonheme iron enzyme [Deltaproteobacteria bacterium]
MKKYFVVLLIFLISGCESTDSPCPQKCEYGYICNTESHQCVADCRLLECPYGCDAYSGLCNSPAEETDCADNIDNDNDGYTDCDDTDCDGINDCIAPVETGPVLCTNMIDDDGDSLIDCLDPDCFEIDVCIQEETWIGSECSDASGCSYEDSICLDDEIFSGMCSLECTQYCPDTDKEGFPITFCVEYPLDSNSGKCVTRCDYSLFPELGCGDGYECVLQSRFNDPSVSVSVCLPLGMIDEEGECLETDVPMPNSGITSPAGIDGCPSGMAPIADGTACMDRWEAHLVEITETGEVPFSPYFNPGTGVMKAVSAPGAVPQGYINQIQAGSACENAGKRLCTDSEWLNGCRGSANSIYPYGNTRMDGICNDARSLHPVVELFGTSDSWIWSELDHPCINQQHDTVDKTGANIQCISTSGHYDTMGNLHEWTADPNGTFRGGYYVDTVINGEGCLYATTAHNVYHFDYSTGFRCCADR